MCFILQVEQPSEKEVLLQQLGRKREELDKAQNELKVNGFLCEW